MSQQIKMYSEQEQTHLNSIISTLHRRKKKTTIQQEVSLKKLYETMNNVVADLDQSINSCKKYNQAKIHRKYQIILNDQTQRIKFLEEKVKEQHRARSPSKKYIEDLLHKLVNYKFQNQGLNKKNIELAQQNTDLKKRLSIYEDHSHRDNNNKNDPKSEQMKNPEINQEEAQKTTQIFGSAIQNEINSYLRVKNELRKHDTNIKKSKFERFLKKIKDKAHLFSMRQLIQAIDKWSIQFTQIDIGVEQIPQFQKLPPSQQGKANRIITTKNQYRNRKTLSFRHLSTKKSIFQDILR